jgi:hypothetical protein
MPANMKTLSQRTGCPPVGANSVGSVRNVSRLPDSSRRPELAQTSGPGRQQHGRTSEGCQTFLALDPTHPLSQTILARPPGCGALLLGLPEVSTALRPPATVCEPSRVRLTLPTDLVTLTTLDLGLKVLGPIGVRSCCGQEWPCHEEAPLKVPPC